MKQEELKSINKKEFADYLGISRQALYMKIKNNKIKKEEIDNFLNNNMKTNQKLNEKIIELKSELKSAKIEIIALKNQIKNLQEESLKESLKQNSREEYEKVLHAYRRASAINLEYMKKYGVLEGLNDNKRSQQQIR